MHLALAGRHFCSFHNFWYYVYHVCYCYYYYCYYCCYYLFHVYQVASIPEPRAQQRATRLARPKPQPKPKLTALKAPRVVRQAPAVPSTTAPPATAAQATGTARVLPRSSRLHHHLNVTGWVAVACQHVVLHLATRSFSWGLQEHDCNLCMLTVSPDDAIKPECT